MKICIDATPIGINTTDKGGVYRYLFELIEALNTLDKENDYTLFFNFFRGKHLPVFYEAIRKLQLGKNFHVKLSRFPPRLYQQLHLPVELLAGSFDVFHGCFDRLPSILSGKGVVTIHDVRYLENLKDNSEPEWAEILRRTAPAPEFHLKDSLIRGELFNHLRLSIRETTQRADVIITVSQFCKARIMDLLGIQKEKIRVIYHGVDRRFRPLSADVISSVLNKYKIEKNYILYSGKFDPLKNLVKLLEAFKIVTLSQDIILVIAGPINWFYYVVLEKAKQLDIVDKIVFTNFVIDEELVALYSGASVFIFPSLYEGFGIPLLEAMACGTPVVTSRVCSIPEVVQDTAFFVDPCSSASIAEGVLKCLAEKDLREEIIRKGRKRVESFSWEKTAKETLQVYEDLQ